MSVIELVMNLDEMEEYEPLPNGLYRGTIRQVEEKRSEKVPNGYFNIQIIVPTDEFPADYDIENNPEGVLLSYARVQIPDPKNRRSVGPFKNLMRVLGLEIGTTIDPDEWIDKEVLVEVTQQVYNDQLVNNVASISSVEV